MDDDWVLNELIRIINSTGHGKGGGKNSHGEGKIDPERLEDVMTAVREKIIKLCGEEKPRKIYIESGIVYVYPDGNIEVHIIKTDESGLKDWP